MSAISFRADLEAEDVRQRLRQALSRIENRQPFLREVGQTLADSTRARFRAETAPDGTPWAPLKSTTLKARLRRRRSAIAILRETGALAGSISFSITGDEVRIGSPLEYAAIHQLGGEIKIPARKQRLRFVKAKEGAGRRFATKKRKRGVIEQDVDISAYQITMPARPFLGISPADETDIFEAAGRWLGL